MDTKTSNNMLETSRALNLSIEDYIKASRAEYDASRTKSAFALICTVDKDIATIGRLIDKLRILEGGDKMVASLKSTLSAAAKKNAGTPLADGTKLNWYIHISIRKAKDGALTSDGKPRLNYGVEVRPLKEKKTPPPSLEALRGKFEKLAELMQLYLDANPDNDAAEKVATLVASLGDGNVADFEVERERETTVIEHLVRKAA